MGDSAQAVASGRRHRAPRASGPGPRRGHSPEGPGPDLYWRGLASRVKRAAWAEATACGSTREGSSSSGGVLCLFAQLGLGWPSHLGPMTQSRYDQRHHGADPRHRVRCGLNRRTCSGRLVSHRQGDWYRLGGGAVIQNSLLHRHSASQPTPARRSRMIGPRTSTRSLRSRRTRIHARDIR
jgi:hypothetical protein